MQLVFLQPAEKRGFGDEQATPRILPTPRTSSAPVSVIPTFCSENPLYEGAYQGLILLSLTGCSSWLPTSLKGTGVSTQTHVTKELHQTCRPAGFFIRDILGHLLTKRWHTLPWAPPFCSVGNCTQWNKMQFLSLFSFSSSFFFCWGEGKL